MKKYSKKMKAIAVTGMVSAIVLVQTGAGFLADTLSSEQKESLSPELSAPNLGSDVSSVVLIDKQTQDTTTNDNSAIQTEANSEQTQGSLDLGNVEEATQVDDSIPQTSLGTDNTSKDSATTTEEGNNSETTANAEQEVKDETSNEENTLPSNKEEEVVLKDIVQEDGSILHPNGSITLTDGTIQYPEGSTLNADGTLTLKDGTIVKPDGTMIYLDGSIKLPNGTLQLPDGSLQFPDGTIKLPDGTIKLPDGSLQLPDGTIKHPDGTSTNPDGTHTNPDGSIVSPGTSNETSPRDESPESPEDDNIVTPGDDISTTPDSEPTSPAEEGTVEDNQTSARPVVKPTKPTSPLQQQTITKNPVFDNTSIERFSKYLQYRNEIHNKLKPQIENLKSGYESRTRLLASLLSKGEEPCKLFRKTAELVDKTGVKIEQAADELSTTLVSKEINNIEITNLGDILAVFVAKSSLSVQDPLDLMSLRNISWDNLEGIFNDMNTVTYIEENGEMHIYLQSYTYEDMAVRYQMTDKQKKVLEELMQPEFQSVFANITGNTFFNTLSQEQILKLKAALPSELNIQQDNIVSTAYSLLGKVSYFWGGKYSQIGSNPSWGLPQLVTAEGSNTSGTIRSNGLDCSGYIAWVFVNATKNPSIAKLVGESTTEQWTNSVSLGWDEAKPGDLIFAKVPGNGINHVGVVVGTKPDGSYLVAHCSSSFNTVVVTDAWSTGLRYVRRPYILVNAQQVAPTTASQSASPQVVKP